MQKRYLLSFKFRASDQFFGSYLVTVITVVSNIVTNSFQTTALLVTSNNDDEGAWLKLTIKTVGAQEQIGTGEQL
jgi:hypothetical protein